MNSYNAIKSRLNHPLFQAKTKIMQGADPIIDVPMAVTLEQLRPSPFNPRYILNPKYDDIKISILESGLKQPPPITRIPGEAHYIISDGVNTRLQILNELWKETGNDRFFNIHCVFKPWVSELHALVGHLSENDLRGDHAFIEKALGVMKAKTIYEEERKRDGEYKAISVRELANVLKKEGYPVSISHLSKMQQTVDYLFPYLDQLLNAGLGRPQIEKILSLRALAEQLWQKYHQDTVVFNDEFGQTISQFNLPDIRINHDILEENVVGMLQEKLNLSYNTVKLELEASKPLAKHQAPLTLIHTEIPAPSEKHAIEKAPVTEKKTIQTEVTVQPHQTDTFSDEVTTTFISEETNDTSPSEITTFEPTPICTSRSSDLMGYDKNDLEPIDDIWHIDDIFDHIESLTGGVGMISRLSLDLARIYQLEACFKVAMSFIGFKIVIDNTEKYTPVQQLILSFLQFVSDTENTPKFTLTIDFLTLLSDTAIIKVLRLMRIVRRALALKGSTNE